MRRGVESRGRDEKNAAVTFGFGAPNGALGTGPAAGNSPVSGWSTTISALGGGGAIGWVVKALAVPGTPLLPGVRRGSPLAMGRALELVCEANAEDAPEAAGGTVEATGCED